MPDRGRGRRVSWERPGQEAWQVPWLGLVTLRAWDDGNFVFWVPAMDVSSHHRILQELKRVTKKRPCSLHAVGRTPAVSTLLCTPPRTHT